jgi:uncharacterized protein (DUF2062 family)
LRAFEEHFHDHNLWHFHRRGVARGVAIGLFCAYLPMPWEMIPAALAAIWLRGNLPISVALVWITNPLTWVPLYAPGYLLGAWLLGQPVPSWDQIGLGTLTRGYGAVWLGCVIIGVVLAFLGYHLVLWIWRQRAAQRWHHRLAMRKEKSQVES